LLLISLCSLISSCNPKLESKEFIEWVRDYENGLHVRKTVSDFTLDLQYQPAAYLALVNSDSSFLQDQKIDRYILKVRPEGVNEDIIQYKAQSSDDIQKRIYYFSYLFQNDIYLLEGGRKIPCVLLHFEPSDLSNDRTFVLGFEKVEGGSSGGESLFVVDSPFFNALPIKIKVSKDRIPPIKV